MLAPFLLCVFVMEGPLFYQAPVLHLKIKRKLEEGGLLLC
jgi:hypothetical protein